MRRIRPQFKPNLGPRTAARPGDTAAKFKPAAAQRPQQVTASGPTSEKPEIHTPLRTGDGKSSEASSSGDTLPALSVSVAEVSVPDGPADSVSDRPPPGSRSPRKAVHDGPKSPPAVPKSPGVLPRSPVRQPKLPLQPKSPARPKSPAASPKSPTMLSKSPPMLPKSPTMLPKSPVRPKSPARSKSPAAQSKSSEGSRSPVVKPRSAALRVKLPTVPSEDHPDAPVSLSVSSLELPKVTSPNKSLASRHPAPGLAKPESSAPASGPPARGGDQAAGKSGGEDQAAVKNTSPDVQGGNLVKKPAAKPAAKSTIVRSARARFKPNLVDSKRRKEPPKTAEKEASEVDTPQGHSECHTSQPDPESRSEVSAVETEPAVAAPELHEISCESEKRSEDETPSELITTEQQIASTEKPEPPPELEGAEQEEVESEVGTVEGGSDIADGGALEGGEQSLEMDSSAAAEDPQNKAVQEKKVRRSKPVLPSTEKSADRAKMKMKDFIYWNPSRNPMTKKENGRVVLTPQADDMEPGAEGAGDEDLEEGEEVPVIQLKLDDNNEIILNEESMTVAGKASDSRHNPTEIVEEDEDRYVTSRSFRDKHQRPKKWSKKETDRFFQALSLVGTDFSLMTQMFPSRSRRDLKNKFSKEDKRNRGLIDKALRERKEFDQTHFDKAREEDAAEIRQMKAIEEEKKRKQKEKMQREQEKEMMREQQEGDKEEERVRKMMEAEQREERKENNRKRRNGKLCKEDGKFPGYKRRKTEAPQSGLTREVVEILVNMSCGKMDSSSSSGGAQKPDQNEDTMSETSSIVSDLDAAATSSPFVPRVARPIQPPQPLLSSRHVVVDPEVSVPAWTVPDGREGKVTATAPADTADQTPADQTPVTGTEDASSPGDEQGPRPSCPPSVSTNMEVAGSQVAMQPTDMVDISSLIESLQAQASTPVDVVLVEQKADSQTQAQDWVHVYLVPRMPSAEEGSQQIGLPPEGGNPISLQTSGATVTNAAVGVEPLLKDEMTGRPVGTPYGGTSSSRSGEGVDMNSNLQVAGGSFTTVVGSSLATEGGERNSLHMPVGPLNHVLTEGGNRNSLQMNGGPLERVVISETLVEGRDNCMQTAEGTLPHSLLHSGERECGQFNLGGTESSHLHNTPAPQREMEKGSSMLMEVDDGSFFIQEGAKTSLSTEGDAGNSTVTAEGFRGDCIASGGDHMMNSEVHPEGSVQNSILTEEIVVTSDVPSTPGQREKCVYSPRYL